jgi:hypothetical protein
LNIIVHYPKCEHDIVALQKKVAVVHADTVIRHIQKLPCPQGQKMKLHNELKRACREKR